MQKNSKALLIQAPVKNTLIKLTIPMIFGMLSMVIFNLVDTFFVGQLGTDELAALTFTFPVVLLVGNIALGLGVGAAAVISKAIGQGNMEKVKRLTTDSLLLSVLIVAVFVTAGLLTIDPVFKLLGAKKELMGMIREYMLIWYPGMLFVIVPMVGNNAIRAKGDTRTPALIMLLASGLNAILDPLLIFGWGFVPSLGIKGAAIATVLSRALTLIFSLYVLYKRDRMLTLDFKKLHPIIKSWKEILYIGLPSALTRLIFPLGMSAITHMLAQFGKETVAGFGVASRIEYFALAVIMALSSVLIPFIGQNWGAGKHQRVEKGIFLSKKFAFLWGLGAFAVLLFLARPISGMFNDNPIVVNVSTFYLQLASLAFGMQGIYMLCNAALNALHRPLHAGVMTFIHVLVLLVPFSFFGGKFWGYQGVVGGMVLATTIAALLNHVVLKLQLSKA